LKIGILANESSWYFRDLARAAGTLGHSCERLDFARLVACTVPGPDVIKTQQAPQPLQCDAVIVRSMPPGSLEQVVFRMDVLSRLEQSGTRIVNSPKSLECAIDKYLTTARLQAAGLPVPDTIVCEHEDDAMVAFEDLGGDVVVKPLFGSEGRGIVRVSDPDLAHRTFRTLMRLDAVLYLQRFIPHSGYDVRVLILGNDVVGAIERRSPNDFRTNVSREATAVAHTLVPQEIQLAVAAASVTGALIAGVDLLYDPSGRCYVIEVNAVPGWQAFGRVTGIDVAARLIHQLMK
jgi:RimK family alpha-L-glutamate ligase